MGIPSNRLDRINSRDWAIAPAVSGGVLINFSNFELVNLTSRRAHRLWMLAAGFATPNASASGSDTEYTRFRTYSDVNFGDFDWAGGSLCGAGAGLGYGYGYLVMDIWAGRAGHLVSGLVIHGISAMAIPSAFAVNGIFLVDYGPGRPHRPARLPA